MKLNVMQELTTFDGQTLPNTKADGSVVPMIVKDVVVNVVMTPLEKDDGMAKLRKYDLAMKLYKADEEVELTLEEAKEIKDCLGKSPYGPVVVGPILHLLG